MKALISCLIVLFFFSTSFINPKTFNPGKEYSLIPSGTLVYGENRKTIQSFYIQKTEVTNKQYREFLNDLLAKGNNEDYEKAKVDSTGWLKHSLFMSKNYHSNPWYDEYPVVNVTREGALLYCKWLAEKFNEKGGVQAPVRLPTTEEWMYAAMGGKENAVMPWGGAFFCNTKGYYLLNFAVDSSYREIALAARAQPKQSFNVVKHYHLGNLAPEERTMFTTPAVSYWANGYGLYNICGNAAEMISEEGRTTAGGSWETSGKYVLIQSIYDAYQNVMGPLPGIGFRPVITFTGE